MSKIKGFTLVEVMIVVAVLAILASVAYPSYQSYVKQKSYGNSKYDDGNSTKLQSYKLANGIMEKIIQLWVMQLIHLLILRCMAKQFHLELDRLIII